MEEENQKPSQSQEGREGEAPMQEFISTAECAEIKGVKRQTIVAAIKRGAIPAQKIGRDYVIRRSDCMRYQPANHAERGRRSAGKPKTRKKESGEE